LSLWRHMLRRCTYSTALGLDGSDRRPDISFSRRHPQCLRSLTRSDGLYQDLPCMEKAASSAVLISLSLFWSEKCGPNFLMNTNWK
jgi:hypothetical protein